MSNRRFEMFHYRQVLVRLRQGDRVWGGTLETVNSQQGKLSFSMQDENGGETRLVLPSGSN